jgi:hypothetical protein
LEKASTFKFYPMEKALVEKYRGKPFALLGVCRDEEVVTGKKTAAAHGMDWRSLHDGPPSRVTNAYNILSWPSFYLIDAEGKIAAKDASWEKIDGEAGKLVAQAASRHELSSAPVQKLNRR